MGPMMQNELQRLFDYEDEAKPSNPSAFPLEYQDGDFQRSMTLRDYFANSAMQGILGNHTVLVEMLKLCDIDKTGNECIASNAYKLADAMLKQREL